MSREVVLAEVGAAIAILGLLLVFLPLFLDAAQKAARGAEPIAELRSRKFRAKLVAAAIALAAAVVSVGLVSVWTDCAPLAIMTGIGLLALTWCVVLLGAMAVATAR